jgi:drug/metabolite transporter (DMT)-like permease
MLVGAVQYGLMYLFFFQAFDFLAAYEVALFTVLTPFWVMLFSEPKRFGFGLIPVALAIIGGAVVHYSNSESVGFGSGFVLLQLSNICFAFGQIQYRRLRPSIPGFTQSITKSVIPATKRAIAQSDASCFAWLFLGGLLVTATTWLLQGGSIAPLTPEAWGAYAYLGIIASGVGFFLWNSGARRVQAPTLAAANNLKIPTAVAVSLVFFGEQIDAFRLLAGGVLIAIAMLWRQPIKT